MGEPVRHSKKLTWSDYRSWPDDERWEIIAGHPYAMAASPSVAHQKVVAALVSKLSSLLAGHRCSVLPSPIYLKLSDEDVVQPDLLIYCDEAQNKGTHIEGPPAVVVEIVSPSSQQHDRMRKLHLYARSGVGEYWLLSPADQILEVLVLKDGTYSIAHVFGPRDELTSPSLTNLRIQLDAVFVTLPYPDQVKEGEPPLARSGATSQSHASDEISR